MKKLLSLILLIVMMMSFGVVFVASAEEQTIKNNVEPSVTMKEGASIRICAPMGIRFSALYNKDKIDSLPENTEIGMYICPTDLLKNGAFDTEQLKNNVLSGEETPSSERYIKKIIVDKNKLLFANDEINYRLNVSLVGIKNYNQDRNFTALAFLGEEIAKNPVTRSISTVAKMAVDNNDPEIENNVEAKKFLNDILSDRNELTLLYGIDTSVKHAGQFSHKINVVNTQDIELSGDKLVGKEKVRVTFFAKSDKEGIKVNNKPISAENFTMIDMVLPVKEKKVILNAVGNGFLYIDDIKINNDKLEWTFDENVDDFKVVNGTITNENGAVTYTGADMNQAHIMNLNINVDADNYRYLNITYKNSTKNGNLVVFFKRETDKEFVRDCQILTNGMAQNNSDYLTYSLDMTKNVNWKGRITGVRVSIQGPNPGSVTFDKIWFSAEKFVQTAWNFDNNCENFVATNGKITWENGAITYTGNNMNAAHIRNMFINVNADNYKYLNVTYKNSTTNDNLVVFFMRQNDTKFEQVCLIQQNGMEKNNSEYVTYSLDMTKNENWKGKIKGIRISIQGQNPGSVTFDKIWFS